MMEALNEAFEEEHTDREIAFSFAFGIFITSLPTLGLGLILFGFLIELAGFISRLAIAASIVIMNPLTKWLFYLSGINLGSLILAGQFFGIKGLEEAITYLLIGSIVLAVILSVTSYFVALKLVRAYRNSELEVIDRLEEAIEEKLEAS